MRIPALAFAFGSMILVIPSFAGATYTLEYSFQKGNDGAYPHAVLSVPGGTLGTQVLVGTTTGGGANGFGTLFTYPGSGSPTTLASFSSNVDSCSGAVFLNPPGPPHGYFGLGCYGGGNSGRGAVWRWEPANPGTISQIFAFSGGNDGSAPAGDLIVRAGRLWGMTFAGGTHNGGVLYSMSYAGGEIVHHNFGGNFPDGKYPLGGLVQQGTKLYGTTANGGPNGAGELFSVLPTFNPPTLICDGLSSPDPNSSVVYYNGAFYGTSIVANQTNGEVYMCANNQITVLHAFAGGSDGYSPQGNIVVSNGYLYGATLYGGSGGIGTVYRINLTPPYQEDILHVFNPFPEGDPDTGVVLFNGALYGTTDASGSADFGTIYRVELVPGAPPRHITTKPIHHVSPR